MKNKLFTTFLACLFCFGLQAQAPQNAGDVMLQGFYWDSNSTTSWTKLYQISGDISGNFDLVWLPPSAFSSGGTGYIPKQWSNQNSDWGTASNLKKLINALKANNCRAIADIVVNHRGDNGVAPYTSFFEDDFGTYGKFTLTKADICSNDDVSGTGSPDTGEGFSGARDLDHNSTNVQNAIKAYLKWMKNEMGFDGWRYDMVKGFKGDVINGYNAAGNAYMSVGEYFDANYDLVKSWIDGTSKTSTAFDFPSKYAALNNGLASNNYAAMAWNDGNIPRPAGLIHSPASRRYAVTFVDNHDTYRDASKYTGDVQKAYAFILSSPGIPCVFYPHWTANKQVINNMIAARKAVGLHSESNVEVQNTTGFYKAYSVGNYGEMLTYIGSGYESNVPGSDWSLACSGTGWAIYTKLTSQTGKTAHEAKVAAGVNPPALSPIGSLTLKAKVPAAWTAPKIWVWDLDATSTNFTGGTWPGVAMTSEGNGIFSITLNNVTAKEVGVIFNDGKATGAAQTIDLSTTKSSCWTVSTTAMASGNFDGTEDPSCFVVGITEIDREIQAVLYPNPAETEVSVYTNKPFVSAEIRSLAGNSLLFSTEKRIPVAGLNSGMYLLNVYTTDGSVQTLKFIKK
ncbi:MAG: starch-binding protein [Dysgonamonadaceae bacterium]|jgi:alpha-amylase|nr:starch-binding protein [Dysgonamonadaceae bacterium]